MKSTPLAGMMGATALLAMVAAESVAAPLEVVRLDGAGGAFTAINDAIASVDDGGVIEIRQAGDYGVTAPSVTLIGGKSYTITATVDGVFSSQGWISDPTSGPVNATVENIVVDRLGTGAAIFMEQHRGDGVMGNAHSLTLNNMLLQSELGEGIRIDGVGENGGAVTLTATGTTFSSLGGSAKAALRVSSTSGGVPNPPQPVGPVIGLTVALTDCVMTSALDRGIRDDGGDNHTWVLNNCTINGGGHRAFHVNSTSNNSTFEFNDCTIISTQEAIHSENHSTNASWTFNRCVIDSSSGTLNDRTIVIRDSNASDVPNTSVDLFNCLILAQVNNDAMETTGVDLRAYHCTIIGNSPEGFDLNTNTGLVTDVRNSIFSGFTEGIASSSNITNQSDYNLFSGGQTVIGPNSLAGVELNLDENYVPLPESLALGFGSTAEEIATAVQGVDINGNSRPGPAGTSPDAGAFEVGSTPGGDDVPEFLSVY